MKYILILSVVFCSFTLGSCLDDTTNLDYKSLVLPDSVFVTNLKNGVRIPYKWEDQKISGQYSVMVGEELQLDVETFYRGEDEITYEWTFEGETISRDAKLRYIFPKTGEGMLLVYRKGAGNALCCRYEVMVRKSFNSGLVILAKDGGVAKLDFIEYYMERNVFVPWDGGQSKVNMNYYVEHSDVYKYSNDGEELGMTEPIRLFRYSGYGPNSFPGIQLLDKNWKTSVTVNSGTMEKLTLMEDEFVGTPASFQAKEFVSAGAMNFVLAESGNIYTRVNYDFGNPATGKYSSEPLAYNDPYDIPDKGPAVIKGKDIYYSGSGYPGMLIYEQEQKRFLMVTATSGTYNNPNIEYNKISDFSSFTSTLPEGCVDLNSFDKEILTILMDMSGNGYLLFKDGGDCYIQFFNLTYSSYVIPHQISYSVSSCKKIPSKVAIALVDGVDFRLFKDKIFFASGNTLYSMGMDGQAIAEEFKFSQNNKITHIGTLNAPVDWMSPAATALKRYYLGKVFCASFDNGDFKMVQIYDDPAKPDKPQYRFLVDKHYAGGVCDIIYY